MRTVLLAALASILCCAAAAAQALTVDLGLVNASGNANFLSFNMGEKYSHTFGPRFTLGENLKVLYGKTEGKTTTESYDVGVRGDYSLTQRVAVFGLVRYQRDPFAGLAERWFGGPGASFNAIQSPRDTLRVESGLTSQSERSTANVTQTFGAARTAAGYKHLFAAKSYFTEVFEWVANLKTSEDQRLNSETALTAPLSTQIGLRLSYVVRFDNQPEPGFKKTDRILTTGVQIAF
jgi:putative salt-induced outer membrane protein